MSPSGTLVIKVDPESPDREAIEQGARIIRQGGIVAFPTETVYGLAVDMGNKKALARLYSVKKRPRGKPFTIHVADLEGVRKAGCRITKRAAILIKKFWPGPLTVILRARGGIKLGFRMPENAVALRLISAAGVGVVAPSANLSGRTPPTRAKDALKDLDGRIDMVLDGGRTRLGRESTVVDITGRVPVILREGAVSPGAIKRALRAR